ncbi:hypothetical protein IEZ26_04570 [Nocardioides cavernae]|uniref:GNAT family N-acetyltransferase n=1 Tax=Nocardioides cavernae TaxID=1921566 RepID=A0ABR8N9K6_9ACTN|nr:hypothetical protein [Nocardioides cavernae]MBD3923886.1 hypothetical protein [Nocardioides cavernae]MBM7511178.1 hypothetical protein [Nocardioides cavernae]
MSPLADWRVAQHSDRGALGVFECAIPPKPIKNAATGYKLDHPRMWEYEVQSWIRGLSSKVPCRPPMRVYVLEDEVGLAAVICWTELEGPAWVHVDVIGVALRHRRSGGDVARAVMRAAFQEMESAALDIGAGELYIEGEIWHENDASQALASDGKLQMVVKHETGAQTWSLRVALEGAEFDGEGELDAARN